MVEDEIVFGSASEISVRENHFSKAIEQLHESIISKCTKCNNGFIDDHKKLRSIDDLAYSSAVECVCRKKAEWYSRLLYSGIPTQFFIPSGSKKLIGFSVDAASNQILELYVEKIKKVRTRGFGILFCGINHEGVSSNFAVARTDCGIRILIHALENEFSVHYITAQRYFSLIKNAMDNNSLRPFIDEIEKVDFLFIDNLSTLTDFELQTFDSLIRERKMQLQPTLISTYMPEDKLDKTLKTETMDLIYDACAKIQITKYDHAKGRKFLSLSHDLEF